MYNAYAISIGLGVTKLATLQTGREDFYKMYSKTKIFIWKSKWNSWSLQNLVYYTECLQIINYDYCPNSKFTLCIECKHNFKPT